MTRNTGRRALLGAVGTALFGGTAYAVVRTAGESDSNIETPQPGADAEPSPTPSHPTEEPKTETPEPPATDPFETVLTPTALPGLEPVEADNSTANDLNDSRTVVGGSRVVTQAEETFRAVRWPDEKTVEDLGTFLDDDERGASEARGINGCGTIVGGADAMGTDDDRRRRAFRWTDDEGLHDLGTLGGPSSEAFGINDDGTVVGAADTGEGERHAFRWTEDEGMYDLGTLRAGNAGDSVARAVTEDDRIVGESDVDGRVCAFTWTEADGMTDLGMLKEGDGSTANDAVGATSVGASFTPGDRRLTRRAVQFADGETTDLGALEPSTPDDTTYAEAFGLNEDGVAVGLSEFTPPERFEFSLRFRAVRFVDGRVEPLGILGETNTGPSVAQAVNTHGTIVGSDRNEGVIRATVWTDD